MIISPVTREHDDASVTHSVTLTFDREEPCVPSKLWYRFPKVYASQLSTRSNGFLIPLVSVAMSRGEDIVVAGEVSSRLLYQLREYQNILHFWRPKEFQNVSITADIQSEIKIPVTQRKSALSSFSGGIDSTYTVWSHLPERVPHSQFGVSHALYIQGFDEHEDEETQKLKIQKLSEVLSAKNIVFIPVATNVHDFFAHTSIAMTYSSMVMGTAAFFEDLFPRFYFSEDCTLDFPAPFGVNHVLTPLLGSERMKVVSVGNTTTRLDKLRAIHTWHDTHSSLFVCHQRPQGLTNCGTCEKCLMTMSLMSMAGILKDYTTFRSELSRKSLRRLRFPSDRLCFVRAWITFAKNAKRHDFAFDFRWVLVMSRIKNTLSHVTPRVHVFRFLNPLVHLYALSSVCKRYVPFYAKLVARVKGQKQTI